MAKGYRYVSRARRTYSRASRSVGGFKSLIAPIGAGVADSYADSLLPVKGVGATAVGMFLHNTTIKDIGLYKVGLSLGNILPLPGISGGGNGALL
jgi:hypothetical protein